MVEVRDIGFEKWEKKLLIGEIAELPITPKRFICATNERLNDVRYYEQMREIEEPKPEESFESAWARVCEKIVKEVIDGMPNETFEFEFGDGKVRIKNVR